MRLFVVTTAAIAALGGGTGVIAAPPPAHQAEGCVAHFEGAVVASWDTNGRTMTLERPFAFVGPKCRRWSVPSGAVVDGASIPRILWAAIGGPFEGLYRNASVVHDWYCAVRTEPYRDVHRMFYEGMIAAGVPKWKALGFYWTVLKAGPSWDDLTVRNSRLLRPLPHGLATVDVTRLLTQVREAAQSDPMIAASYARAAQQAAMTDTDQRLIGAALINVGKSTTDPSLTLEGFDQLVASRQVPHAYLSADLVQAAQTALNAGDKETAWAAASRAYTLQPSDQGLARFVSQLAKIPQQQARHEVTADEEQQIEARAKAENLEPEDIERLAVGTPRG
jgi:hypothetical protein